MQDIIYKRVESNEELNQILELQRINIPTSISEDESKIEDFVTVHYDFEILKAMNNNVLISLPRITAKWLDIRFVC